MIPPNTSVASPLNLINCNLLDREEIVCRSIDAGRQQDRQHHALQRCKHVLIPQHETALLPGANCG
ncbi:hypothetical protein LMTR13_21475 [Bradyrhizobium icense]|uniref:Uncharacterized protein n=1 Tax=Bradyrhizobium icense TaxID=1274631 RepID=A0A1B1UHY0_9BRAD|nr:hypothetical protein LMTR13_21475 [Bradyrhizobium icense]